MSHLKIDLINPDTPETQAKSRKRRFVLIGVLIVVVAGFLSSPFLFARNAGLSPSFVWTQLKNLGFSKDKLLQGETDNRVNILLLGMGGVGHDGAYLTDTIILASLRPSDGKVALLSIPRDLLVPIPGYGWRRVNNINSFAETEEKGSGGFKTTEALSQLLEIPIHYFARLDFKGFQKIIDEVDGLRINVDQEFTDNLYPTEDYKTQTISFNTGWQTMDGERALQFVRSRHGGNGEGSDFARSHRQQKVLMAFKNKLLSFETLIRPSRLRRISEDLKQHFSANLQSWEVMRLAKILRQTTKDKIALQVLEEGPDKPLEARMIEGAFILQPKNNDWQMIRGIVANLLEQQGAQADFQDVAVEVQNGTFLPGLAGQTAQQLQKLGFNVVAYGNAPKRDYQKTVIYNLSDANHKDALRKLQEILKADISLSSPLWMQAETSPASSGEVQAEKPKADFLVVIGTN